MHHNLPGSFVERHSHPEHHLIIPLQGEISVEIGEQQSRSLNCSPGRMVYIAPNALHSLRSSEQKGERLICMINPVAWQNKGAGSFETRLAPASQLCKEILFYLLVNPKSKNTPSMIDVLVRTVDEILSAARIETAALIERAESGMSRADLRKAIDIARQGCSDGISVSELARKSGLSVRNLSRLFRYEMGITPKQLLTFLRIERAKDLLNSGQHTVTEAAYSVGYSSLSQCISSIS